MTNLVETKLNSELLPGERLLWSGQPRQGAKLRPADFVVGIIDEVLKANPAMVEEFKAGKEKAFNALVGQAMKASKGKANPAQVNEILKKKLS